MKAIRLLNGHFDGQTEAISGEPRRHIHRRLPQGDWVDAVTGQPATHDLYDLTVDETSQPVYRCTKRTIERSTWLKVQALKQAR